MPLHVADGSVGHDAAYVDLYLAAEVICDADLHVEVQNLLQRQSLASSMRMRLASNEPYEQAVADRAQRQLVVSDCAAADQMEQIRLVS